jgi:hypothetical protein
MVSADEQDSESSVSTPWLVDDLLDEIAAHPEVDEAAAGDPGLRERLAAITALGFFLAHPPTKQLSISGDALFDPRVNAGWAMAAASLRAWDERYDGSPDPSAVDRDYRFLIAQSQVHRQLARRACADFNPMYLARFHKQLCSWFLNTTCTPRLARAMRTVSSTGIAALGLPSPVAGESAAPLAASVAEKPPGYGPA